MLTKSLKNECIWNSFILRVCHITLFYSKQFNDVSIHIGASIFFFSIKNPRINHTQNVNRIKLSRFSRCDGNYGPRFRKRRNHFRFITLSFYVLYIEYISGPHKASIYHAISRPSAQKGAQISETWWMTRRATLRFAKGKYSKYLLTCM